MVALWSKRSSWKVGPNVWSLNPQLLSDEVFCPLWILTPQWLCTSNSAGGRPRLRRRTAGERRGFSSPCGLPGKCLPLRPSESFFWAFLWRLVKMSVIIFLGEQLAKNCPVLIGFCCRWRKKIFVPLEGRFPMASYSYLYVPAGFWLIHSTEAFSFQKIVPCLILIEM